MENFSDTLLEDWMNNDPELLALLEEIDLQAETEAERARIAFHKLAEKYNLPKYPDDVNETEDIDGLDVDAPISLYEALGKIKFVDPNPDTLKSNVLMAAYLSKNNYEPLIEEELEDYLGGDALAGLGFKGEDIDVEMIPIRKGESWFDKGCTFFVKEE